MSRNRKFKKKIKNIFATVATLLLIVGVSVGVTLALLWGKSNVKENVFKGSKGVDAVLWESAWDNSSADVPSPDPASISGNNTLGINIAKKYTPGLDIPKNPKLTNKSEGEKVWVMLRVQYSIQADSSALNENDSPYIPVTEGTFAKIATVQHGSPYVNGLNITDWSAMSDNPKNDDNTNGTCYYYYYYKTKLDKAGEANCETTTLFDNIKILDNFHNSIVVPDTDPLAETKRYIIEPANTTAFNAGAYYTYALLPAFKINIDGAVISVEDGDPDNLDTADDTSATRTKEEIRNKLKETFTKTGTSGN